MPPFWLQTVPIGAGCIVGAPLVHVLCKHWFPPVEGTSVLSTWLTMRPAALHTLTRQSPGVWSATVEPGVQTAVLPQTFAVPPPPQVCGALHEPQLIVPPHPSETVPQFAPSRVHVFGVHALGEQSAPVKPGAQAQTPLVQRPFPEQLFGQDEDAAGQAAIVPSAAVGFASETVTCWTVASTKPFISTDKSYVPGGTRSMVNAPVGPVKTLNARPGTCTSAPAKFTTLVAQVN